MWWSPYWTASRCCTLTGRAWPTKTSWNTRILTSRPTLMVRCSSCLLSKSLCCWYKQSNSLTHTHTRSNTQIPTHTHTRILRSRLTLMTRWLSCLLSKSHVVVTHKKPTKNKKTKHTHTHTHRILTSRITLMIWCLNCLQRKPINGAVTVICIAFIVVCVGFLVSFLTFV